MKNPRLVGVDYGTKRVGVAVADPLRIFARPYGTYDPTQAVEVLEKLHREEGIDVIVVGWPLTPEGDEGEATAFVQPFVNRLKNAFPDVEVVKWDERFSSARAREAIREAGVKRKDRRDRARIDAAAAALILQEYLDERKAS